MSAFMLEYWDKEHWEVTLTSDERLKAGLQHGAWEGGHPSGRRVRHMFCQALTLSSGAHHDIKIILTWPVSNLDSWIFARCTECLNRYRPRYLQAHATRLCMTQV